MGIVDYLSREPNGELWPESEFDEKFVVTSIQNFRKSSRLFEQSIQRSRRARPERKYSRTV